MNNTMLPMIMNKQNKEQKNTKSTIEYMLQDRAFAKNKSYGEHATPIIAPKNIIQVDQKG